MDPFAAAARFCAQSFRFVPTNEISRAWGRFSRSAASRHLIRPFAKLFRINTDDAELDPGQYSSLCAFFTRRLKPGSRPIDLDPQAVVSPVDGRMLTVGQCDQDLLLQVKGSTYNIFGLLRDATMAKRFENGSFTTLYLSPQDYHRVHAPLDLSICGLAYMPGTLFPVNRPTVRFVEGLYTQNERVTLFAESPAGSVALVMVGAHCVGSMVFGFNGFKTNQPGVGPKRLNFDRPYSVKKGDELGMFEMGSTVVLLFERKRVVLDLSEANPIVRMGRRIGSLLEDPDSLTPKL